MCLWNVTTGDLYRVLQHSLDVRSVTFNSSVMFTTDENSDIFVWDLVKVRDLGEDQLLHTLTGN